MVTSRHRAATRVSDAHGLGKGFKTRNENCHGRELYRGELFHESDRNHGSNMFSEFQVPQISAR